MVNKGIQANDATADERQDGQSGSLPVRGVTGVSSRAAIW
jgi:hypothetical protein